MHRRTQMSQNFGKGLSKSYGMMNLQFFPQQTSAMSRKAQKNEPKIQARRDGQIG
jgi:hypothetical protein